VILIKARNPGLRQLLAESFRGPIMKHAVIVAHPNAHSLTRSAAASYAAAARAIGHDVVVRDLYAMDFDPRLQADEIAATPAPKPAADVVAERKLLADADVFALVYPFWFNAAPAILKGYVDRVFCAGFGFEATVGGGTEPALNGKRLISFSFSGAPDQWVQTTGALKALMSIFDSHLAQMCGLELVDHIHTGGIVPNMTPEAVAEVLGHVGDTVKTLFGRQAVWSLADLG
jgi:NAD(P)H dehydrogenase (quinone)